MSNDFGNVSELQQGVLKKGDLIAQFQKRIAELEQENHVYRAQIKNASASHNQYQELFENSPFAIVEADFSEAKNFLTTLEDHGNIYLDQFLSSPSSAEKNKHFLARILDVNQACLLLFGMPNKETLNQYYQGVYNDPQYAGFVVQFISRVEEGALYYEQDVHIHPPALDDLWLKIIVSVTPSYKDTLQQVTITLTDLSARKHAEEILRQSEERFRTLFETMGQGVLYFDHDFYIVQANPTAQKILGRELNEILGKTIQDPQWKFIDQHGDPLFKTASMQNFTDPFEISIQNRIIGVFNPQRQEYRWLEASFIPQVWKGERQTAPSYLIFDDVTEHLQQESERETLLAKTRQQAERMDAIIQISTSLRQAQTDMDVLRILAEKTAQGLRADMSLLCLVEKDNLFFAEGTGYWRQFVGQQQGIDQGNLHALLYDLQLVFLNSPATHHQINFPPCFKPLFKQIQACMIIPLRTVDLPIGLLMVGYHQLPAASDDRVNLAAAIGEIAGNTIQRIRLMSSLEALAISRTRDLTSLYNVISTASSSLDVETILTSVLQQILNLVDSHSGAVLLLDETRTHLKITACQGVPMRIRQLISTQPVSELAESWVIKHGEPLLISDIKKDPRFLYSEYPEKSPYTYLGLPMRARGQVVGVIYLLREKLSFNPEEITLISSITDHIALIVDNLVLHQRSEQAAILEERNRLARDLHDSVTQTLYSTTLYAEASRVLAQQGKLEPLKAYLDRLAQTSQQALKEMRLMVYELRPPSIEQDGLVTALHNRLEAVEGRAGIQTQLEVLNLVNLPPAVEEQIFWIAMESLNNSLRHSGATRVNMCLKTEGEQIVLSVHDNGKGFELEKALHCGGMGLSNMHQRAEKINARLDIQSTLGAGTLITIYYRPHSNRSV